MQEGIEINTPILIGRNVKAEKRRAGMYVGLFVTLLMGAFLLRRSTWQSSVHLHTLLEAIATVLALIVGVIALVRFYTRKNNTILFVGVGFLGTALLDGYHTLVTSTFFADDFPSPPPPLSAWSWIASRVFLSVLLWLSYLVWRREARRGVSSRISERLIYLTVGVLTLATFLFFALVPLPRAYYPEFIVHRPEELVPALFLLLALIGYVRKGHWKQEAVEHWLVFSIIVGFTCQIGFLPFSGRLYDVMFDAAHVLKDASYALVLTGLVIGTYDLFRRAEQSTQQLARVNRALQREILERRQAEAALRKAHDEMERRVQERTAELSTSNALLKQEIAERQRIEEALRVSEEQYRLLFERNPHPMWVYDRETLSFLAVNEAAIRHYGYAREEFLAMTIKDIRPPEDIPALLEIISKERAGLEAAGTWRHKKKDGTIIDVDIIAHPLVFAGRRAELVLAHDVTERKRAEVQLRKLSRAVEQSPSVVIITDTAGRIEYVNPRFTQITGYPAEEVTGQNPRILKSGETPPEEYTRLWETIASGSEWRGELHNKKKNGDFFWVAASISPIKNAKGEITHFLAVQEDITERKRAEEALKQKADELARSNAELEQFAYVASHDLQEPLRMVASYLQLLKRRYQGQLGADADEFIEYAVEGAVRMQELINDLLAYSRVGARGNSFEPTDCAAVFDQAIANLQEVIRETGAVVTCDPLPTVMADWIQMVQLFQNLIGNAIKFRGQATPRVHVSARQEGQKWVLSFRDNGIGIETEYADRIFEIFQRLHTRAEYPGTGIGLAICKKIVERHGGRIWVDSEPGTGATFYVAVSACASRQPRHQPTNHRQRGDHEQPKKQPAHRDSDGGR